MLLKSLKTQRINLRDAILKEVDYQFENALRECSTIKELIQSEPEVLDDIDNYFISEGINKAIREAYRIKVDAYIGRRSL